MGFPTLDLHRIRVPTADAGGEAGSTPGAGVLPPQAFASIGARVRALRLEAGWTQAELGKPFSKGYISQIESGRLAPSLALLSVIATRLGTSVERLAPEIETGNRSEDVARLWDAAERLGRHGENESEIGMLEQATRLAAVVDDPALRGQSMLRYADALRRAGQAGAALEAVAGAFEALGSAGPSRLFGQCYLAAALAHRDRGDLERARSCFEQVLKRTPRGDVGHTQALIGLSRMLLHGGLTQEAAQRLRQAIALGRQHGDGCEEADARLLLAESMRLEGKAQQARSELEAAAALIEGLDDTGLALRLRALAALAQDVEQGQWEQGVEDCLQAAEAARDHETCVTLCHALLEARLARGAGEEAARVAARCIAHAHSAGDWHRFAALQSRQALALALSGEIEQAAAALIGCREAYMALHRPDALARDLNAVDARLAGVAPTLQLLLDTPPLA